MHRHHLTLSFCVSTLIYMPKHCNNGLDCDETICTCFCEGCVLADTSDEGEEDDFLFSGDDE